MSVLNLLNLNTSEYNSIPGKNDIADNNVNWIPPLTQTPYHDTNTSSYDPLLTETPYHDTNTSSYELASITAILEKCSFQLLDRYPPFENFSHEEKHFAVCDFCALDEKELDVLYSDLTCVSTVYYPVSVFCVLFGLVFVLGLVGNVLVICGVRTGGRALSSVMHMFIANVAVGDLLIVLICLPFTVTSTMVLHYWPFGKALCVGVSYLQAVSVFVSSYSLVAVAIDRYMAIIYPLRPRITRLTAKVAIGTIWILAFATGIPVAYYSTLMVPAEGYHLHHNVSVCQEVWPEDYQELRWIYSLVLLALHYFLPVAVMVFTYARIAQRVWCSKESRDVRRFKASAQLSYSFSTSVGTLQRQSSSSSTKGGTPHSPTSPTTAPGQSPVKLISMTVTVVSVYSMCWLPFNVLMVMQEYRREIHHMTGFHYLWAGCYFLAMLHTVFNVILLYWLNPVFRYSVLKLLCKLFPCCRASLEFRLQRLSSSRFHRKNTFTNSHGGANCTVSVRQSGSLQRRYHRTPSDRGHSVTRTSSTRTVEETIFLATIPRASNNPGVSSPNDLSTLHEMSSDALSDPDAITVIAKSFLTLPPLAPSRGSDEVGDPLLSRHRDTVTTDDDCRSDIGDRVNRRTFSDTDEVFLPNQHGDFEESPGVDDEDISGCQFFGSQTSRRDDGDQNFMDDSLTEVEAFHRPGNSRQDKSSEGSEYECDRNQLQGINRNLQADQMRQRDIVLKLGNPEDAGVGLLHRQNSIEWDEEELILPDTLQVRNVHKMKRMSNTKKTTSIVHDNSTEVTVSKEEFVVSSCITLDEDQHNTDIQRNDSTRFTFVLAPE